MNRVDRRQDTNAESLQQFLTYKLVLLTLLNVLLVKAISVLLSCDPEHFNMDEKCSVSFSEIIFSFLC